MPITLVSTHAELEQRIGGRRSSWVYGAAIPDSLVMLTPLRYSPTFNGHRYADVFQLVPHELTRLIVAQIVGYPGFREMPQWLNEGLAGSITGYLIETYGADKIPLMLGALAKGVDFDTALQQAIGIDGATLEQQW